MFFLLFSWRKHICICFILKIKPNLGAGPPDLKQIEVVVIWRIMYGL